MVSSVGVGVGVASAAVALVAAWHALTYYEVDVKCEKPKFSVVRSIGSKKDWLGRQKPIAELRRYPSLLAAQITIDGKMREALSGGFRALAGYIFGKNTSVKPSEEGSEQVAMTAPVMVDESSKSEKVAMTSPVTTEMSSDGTGGEYTGTHVVSFMMPSKYTKETLPKPLNPDVKIVEIPSRILAALMWRGKSPSEKLVAEKEKELRHALEQDGLKAKGALQLWQYVF